MNLFALRALGIGDLAVTVPALRGIRARYPRARVTIGVPGWLAPLARLTGAVDRTIDVPRLAGVRIEPPDLAPPDLAVNLHGRGPQSHRLLAATRPRRMLAFACPAAGFHDGPPYHLGVEEHEVSRWNRMLAWYGIEARDDDLALSRPSASEVGSAWTLDAGEGWTAGVESAVIVHPGAKDPERRWPARRHAAVARRLAGEGRHVVVTGSAAERELACRVAAEAGLGPDRVLAGRTGVAALAALVADAGLVVSGDTGISHLATAYRTPSVTLFGAMSPARWGPPAGAAIHRAIWHGGGRGGRHGDVRGNLAGITVDEVRDAVDGVLAAARAIHAAGSTGPVAADAAGVDAGRSPVAIGRLS